MGCGVKARLGYAVPTRGIRNALRAFATGVFCAPSRQASTLAKCRGYETRLTAALPGVVGWVGRYPFPIVIFSSISEAFDSVLWVFLRPTTRTYTSGKFEAARRFSAPIVTAPFAGVLGHGNLALAHDDLVYRHTPRGVLRSATTS